MLAGKSPLIHERVYTSSPGVGHACSLGQLWRIDR